MFLRSPTTLETPILYKAGKMGWKVAQLVMGLPCKHEARAWAQSSSTHIETRSSDSTYNSSAKEEKTDASLTLLDNQCSRISKLQKETLFRKIR